MTNNGATLAQFIITDIAHLRRCRSSQSHVAREAGISGPSRLSRIERGECSPSLDELIGLADAVGVPLSQLVREAEDRLAGRRPTAVVDLAAVGRMRFRLA